MEVFRRWHIGFVGLMVVAAALYLLRWSHYYAGMIKDDAVYILGAKSLLKGHYRALHYPGLPPCVLPFYAESADRIYITPDSV